MTNIAMNIVPEDIYDPTKENQYNKVITIQLP